jgi:hypothetical protein
MTQGRLGRKPDWADWIDVAKYIGADPVAMIDSPNGPQMYQWGKWKMLAEWEAAHPDEAKG